MKEGSLRKAVHGALAAMFLTAGCEATARPIPTPSPVPTPTREPVARPIPIPERLQQEIKTPIGKARLFFPFGEARPEHGVYTLVAEMALLKKVAEGGYAGIYVRPGLRLEVEIRPDYGEKKISVVGRIAKGSDVEFRDIRGMEVAGVNFDNPYLLVLSWENWRFKSLFVGRGERERDLPRTGF